MEDAYIVTIEDFKNDLRNTEWWRFGHIRWLNSQIKHYEKLLEELRNNKS